MTTYSDHLKIEDVDEGVLQAHVPHNEGIHILDIIARKAVVDRTPTTPGSPTSGQMWIILGAPTGQWATDTRSANDVAIWLGGSWHYFTPSKGWLFMVMDEDVFYTFTGSTWVVYHQAAIDLDITNNSTGTPSDTIPDLSMANSTAGASANQDLQALTDPVDTPVDADALRDDLASVLLPELRNNFTELFERDDLFMHAIASLATEINDLKAKLRTAKLLAT